MIMTDTSNKLDLPFLFPAQAQKHVSYNEAIERLDALVQLSVISRQVGDSGVKAQLGDVYIIPDMADGAWADRVGELAVWTASGWTYIAARTGWRSWLQDERADVIFLEGEGWENMQSGQAAEHVERFGINASADDVNRLSMNADASLFNHDGQDHRLVINRASISDTASIIFQTDFVGQIEAGLTSAESFDIRVSRDGVSFQSSMSIDTSGHVDFPRGMNQPLLADAVADAGADTRVIGPPNLITVGVGRRIFGLVANRCFFSPFYVDRVTEYIGANVALTQAPSEADAVLRAGLYRVGEAAGNSWNVGQLEIDLGAQVCSEPGHYEFTNEAGILLQPGWYLQVLCTNGSGAQVRCLEWRTPGVLQFIPNHSSSDVDYRLGGIARYLTDNVDSSVAIEGLPTIWQSNPAADAVSSVFTQLIMGVPIWRRESWA